MQIIHKEWCKQIHRKVGFILHSECRQGGLRRVDVPDTTLILITTSLVLILKPGMGCGEASPTLWKEKNMLVQ